MCVSVCAHARTYVQRVEECWILRSWSYRQTIDHKKIIMLLRILNISHEAEAHRNNMTYPYSHNFSIGLAFLIPKPTLLSVPKPGKQQQQPTLKSEPCHFGEFFY